jgi:RNA polymerase sigma-70 factor, ECF subfamily
MRTRTADEHDWLAERFEERRARLRAVALRMLGSLSEADDAVQESWLRLSRSDASVIENLDGWLMTVVARVCLNMLRARDARREESLGPHVPEPIVSREDGVDPEYEAILADSVGLALLVVLDTLAPAERLVFVLHDMFEVPFEEIAPIIDRSPAASRQLAMRARRRVRGTPVPDRDLARQRAVVDAFLDAARDGDFEALMAVLDPDVVRRADFGAAPAPASPVVRGAEAVASQALGFARQHGPGVVARPALVNGAVGAVAFRDGRPLSVLGFTVSDGKIVAIDVLLDPVRLREFEVAFLDEPDAQLR